MKTTTIIPATLGLCASACLAGTTMQSTPSSTQWVGDVRTGISHTNLNGETNAFPGEGEESSFSAIELELQLGRDFGAYFLQFDVLAEMTGADSSANDSYQHGYMFATHLMRETSFGGVGGFIGLIYTEQDNDTTDDSWRYLAGFESKVDSSFADYYFQLGYLFGEDGSDDGGEDSLHNTLFGRVVARKQLTDTVSLTGEAGYAIGKMDDSDHFNLYNLGVALNKRFSSDLVGSLSYDYTYYRQDDSAIDLDEIHEHIFGFSLTYSFGSGSGATDLGLPRVVRWTGITGGQME